MARSTSFLREYHSADEANAGIARECADGRTEAVSMSSTIEPGGYRNATTLYIMFRRAVETPSDVPMS